MSGSVPCLGAHVKNTEPAPEFVFCETGFSRFPRVASVITPRSGWSLSVPWGSGAIRIRSGARRLSSRFSWLARLPSREWVNTAADELKRHLRLTLETLETLETREGRSRAMHDCAFSVRLSSPTDCLDFSLAPEVRMR